MTIRIGLLVSRVRVEERMIAEEMAARGVQCTMIDVRDLVWDVHGDCRLRDGSPLEHVDLVLERCISQTQGLTAARLFEAAGVPCVNSAAVIETCGDKLATSLTLVREGVPTPRVLVGVEPESALAAVERMGYPCVLKPTSGSWGRLLARLNDRHAAEAVIEHKATLGSVQHGVFYVQEFIEKPGRDLRVFVVGDEAVAGIARYSDHWITNTARGGRAEAFDVSGEEGDLAVRAARAVGGGVLAVDLLEAPGRGLLVSEVNHTMEFRNSVEPTGVNIPGRIVEFAVQAARNRDRGSAESNARRHRALNGHAGVPASLGGRA